MPVVPMIASQVLKRNAASRERNSPTKPLVPGKPIVIPDVYEVDAIRDLVYVARDREEYVAHLDAALAEGAALRPRRIEYASQFSYAKVLERIAAPICEIEARRRA